jgi:transposase
LINSILPEKKNLRATEQDTEKVQQHRKEYAEEIKEIDPDDLIFIDETGSNIAMCRQYARSPKGERIHDTRPSKRKGNVTIIGALSISGIVAAMTINGSADGAVFLAYTTEILVPQLRPGNVVVMDNINIHKVAGIKQAIESVGARLINLPEYSPDLNPIEECWSKVKAILRTVAARTLETLEQAITQALASVTEKDAIGWFTHAGYCIASE